MTNGSASEMWLTTTMQAPAGKFSHPRQSGLLNSAVAGLTSDTANRPQNPSLRRVTPALLSCFSQHHVTPRALCGNYACQNRQMSADRFTLLVPLKPLSAAKSRLRGAVPGTRHEELV